MIAGLFEDVLVHLFVTCVSLLWSLCLAVCWLVGRLFFSCCLVGRLVGWLVGWLRVCLPSRTITCLCVWLCVDVFVACVWSLGRLVDCVFVCLFERCMRCAFDRFLVCMFISLCVCSCCVKLSIAWLVGSLRT